MSIFTCHNCVVLKPEDKRANEEEVKQALQRKCKNWKLFKDVRLFILVLNDHCNPLANATTRLPQATSTSYDDSTWTNHATRRTINSISDDDDDKCSQWKLIQQVTRTALIYSPPRLPLLTLFIVSVDATILKPTNGFFFFQWTCCHFYHQLQALNISKVLGQTC